MTRKTTKIGLVDLDTSHPAGWVPILRELGHEVVGVYDGGSTHPAGFAEQFAAEHKIDRVFSNLDDLADSVDLGIIHGCDWDTHRAKAKVFVDRQKPVFIDKPLAGNCDDLKQFVRWSDRGAKISGGSALRFCDEVRDFLARPVSDRGIPQTVFVTCGFDEFNYGIHAYALLLGLMGSDVVSVQHLREGAQLRVRINWADDRTGIVVIGHSGQHLPFTATVVTEHTVFQTPIDTERLYRAVLETALPFLVGDEPHPPLPMRELIKPELCAIAAKQSARDAGRVVRLKDMSLKMSRYDGRAFANAYRRLKYPDPPVAVPV